MECDNRFVVLIDEEYGFRNHFFFPSKTPEQFIQWWKELDTVKSFYFHPSDIAENNEEALITTESEEDDAQWDAMNKSNQHIFMHLHTDGDSFMRLPDGSEIFHKGYDEHYFNPKAGDVCTHFDEKTGQIIMGHLDDDLNFAYDNMSDDPDIKSENASITKEFEVADMDGLESDKE
jgi:hypothetical protein